MNAIRPIHHSIKELGSRRITPHNMSRISMGRDMTESMSNIALSIFTDAVNVGVGFQEAILAVYISGLENGVSALKEANQEQSNER